MVRRSVARSVAVVEQIVEEVIEAAEIAEPTAAGAEPAAALQEILEQLLHRRVERLRVEAHRGADDVEKVELSEVFVAVRLVEPVRGDRLHARGERRLDGGELVDEGARRRD